MRAFVVIVFVVAGCADQQWKECSSGLLCPSPKVCAEPSGLCVSETQVSVCEGRPEGAACSLQPAQSSLNAIWAASALDAFAVGDAGTFVRFDGATWSVVAVTDATSQMNGVWGTDRSNVFAVGDEGAAYRFDGTEWSSIPTDAPASIEAVFGTGSEVWAAGDSWIGRFDGTQFGAVDTGLPAFNATALWMTGSHVYAPTDSGAIVHFDGATWEEVDIGFQIEMSGIWGTGPTEIYAVGVNGTIVRYAGALPWEVMDSGTTGDLEEIHGTGTASIFAAGTQGSLLHFDGTIWMPIASGVTTNLNSIVTVGTAGFAVGEGGAIVEGEGLAWSPAITDGQCIYKVCQSTPEGP